MTFIDIVTIVFGLFVGYWVVGKLFFRSRRGGPGSAKGSAGSSARPGSESKQGDGSSQGAGSGSGQDSGQSTGTSAWYTVLQVAPAATVAEIRAAYRQRISQYHPDKVESLGSELKELAARKAQEITVAYQDGMRARGERA